MPGMVLKSQRYGSDGIFFFVLFCFIRWDLFQMGIVVTCAVICILFQVILLFVIEYSVSL